MRISASSITTVATYEHHLSKDSILRSREEAYSFTTLQFTPQQQQNNNETTFISAKFL